MFNWLMGWHSRSEPTTANRRMATRYSCARSRDKLAVSIGIAAWPAIVRDISTTGIGLVVGMHQHKGSVLPIELTSSNTSTPRAVQAQVVRIELLPDGHWFCGCAFDQKLDESDLKDML